MSLIHRLARLGALALFATAITGCCVLPYGPRGRGYGYDEGGVQRHAPHGEGRGY